MLITLLSSAHGTPPSSMPQDVPGEGSTALSSWRREAARSPGTVRTPPSAAAQPSGIPLFKAKPVLLAPVDVVFLSTEPRNLGPPEKRNQQPVLKQIAALALSTKVGLRANGQYTCSHSCRRVCSRCHDLQGPDPSCAPFISPHGPRGWETVQELRKLGHQVTCPESHREQGGPGFEEGVPFGSTAHPPPPMPFLGAKPGCWHSDFGGPGRRGCRLCEQGGRATL